MTTPRYGILAAGTLLVDHVHLIDDWPEQGRLATILKSESATGGAVPNVLRTLARMKTGCRWQQQGWLAMIWMANLSASV